MTSFVQQSPRRNSVDNNGINSTQAWHPPPINTLKFSSHVAWKEGESNAAIAVVVRNHVGKVIDGAARLVHCSSPSSRRGDRQFSWRLPWEPTPSSLIGLRGSYLSP
ncbi:hypothetical protein P3X46_007745 [Hevea brasiliensis]|uniref:RNase H type-1 domain-containing protein n=1 Tax=Hevea brasiliensis TaxID=3981 RepID=A0ABQ9MXI1_HEVBR|nr:hypothetical protein P3X46_007745 [Hevea brasiliensis]